MAGAYSNPPFSIRPSSTTKPPILISKKPLLLACSLITPSPRKLTQRKNYLRQKILKTLTKPYRNNPQTEPIGPLETPIQHTHIFPADQVASGELKLPENHELWLPEVSESGRVVDVTEPTVSGNPLEQTHILPYELNTSENQEIQLSESATFGNADAGYFTKSSLLRDGLWIVGALLFQTICVLLLEVAYYSGPNESLDQDGVTNEVLELDPKDKSKYRMRTLENGDGKQSTENGGIVSVDEAEMKKKIEEIQQMAREARKKERLESKGSNADEESEDEIEDGDVEIGIKKEVEERLIKLRNRLEKVGHKQPTNSVTYPRAGVNDKDVGGNSDEKEVDSALIYKRKHKFRDFSSKPSNKPNGFVAPDHQSVIKNGKRTFRGKTKVLTNGNGESGKGGVVRAVENSLEKRGRKKKGVASDLVESEPGIDSTESSIQETAITSNTGNTLVEVVDSKESFSMKSTTTMNRRKKSNGNGISRTKEVKGQKVVKPNGGTKSGTSTDFWWLSLPYVFVICMRRGLDDEGPEGLFSLNSSSQANDDLSHTVAFEDRGDATNFCYLLQSFFEDLGDFSAEVVPLPAKELSNAVRSDTMKVIVVKKGEVKLYAGQPLTDAEMALRSLVEQQ